MRRNKSKQRQMYENYYRQFRRNKSFKRLRPRINIAKVAAQKAEHSLFIREWKPIGWSNLARYETWSALKETNDPTRWLPF